MRIAITIILLLILLVPVSFAQLVIPLTEGENLISINVIPPQEFFREGEDRGPDVELMFEQIQDQIVLLLNHDGAFYVPEWGFNSIEFWDFTQAYMIEVEEETEFSIDGDLIPFDTDIQLREGENWIAYFPDFELDASAPDFWVLSPIINVVVRAADWQGNTMIPEENFSNMEPWHAGMGYIVVVTEDVVLNYPNIPELRWLALPDSGFVEDGSLQLSLEYLYDHIRSLDFPDEDLVISVEDGEHLFGEVNDEGLTITAEEDWNGIDSLLLTVTNPDENSDTTYQRLIVFPLEWWQLPDSGFVEDGSLSLSLDYLYEHINAMGIPDTALVITVEDGEFIHGELSDVRLVVSADPNWNGLDSLMVTVTDPNENSATTYQRLTAHPLNDLPSTFGLVEPTDNATVADYPAVMFGWEESVDEADGDTVTYALVLTLNEEEQWYPYIETTTIEVSREDLSIDPNMETILQWVVWAYDGTDSLQCNEPFSLTVTPLSVSENDDLLPIELSLGPIYPNPFNAATTIRYGLPIPSHVSLEVYNTLGQRITTLFEGYQHTGFHTTTLTVDNLSSGLYFIKLETSGQVVNRKVMLVK